MSSHTASVLFERRVHTRYPAPLPVSVVADAQQTGQAVDLGPGGARVRLRALLRPGSEIDLAFRVSQLDDEHRVRGTVLRTRPTPGADRSRWPFEAVIEFDEPKLVLDAWLPFLEQD